MSRRRTAAVIVVTILFLGTAACGQAVPGSGPVVDTEVPPPPSTATAPDWREGAPPPVTVSGGGTRADLTAWTWCFTGGCADGAPPERPVDFGTAEELHVSFPEPGWTFEAIFSPSDQPCGRRQLVPLETDRDGDHVVRPAGPAGTYDVDLFGRGPHGEGGDVVVTARWTTTVDGPMPVPTASLGVLSEHDGVLDSYGVELLLDDLAATPEQATATVTVTSSEGRSLTLEALRSTGGCGEEGSVFFDGPDGPGREAVSLGTAPFTYDVVLVLDGVRHTASASWPADVIEDSGSAVALHFSPALPALGVATPAG